MTGQTVIEDDDWREPRPIGLLDQYGNPIVRMPEPIGFIHPAEAECVIVDDTEEAAD